MPYVLDYQTHREKAGLRIRTVAENANLSPDTIKNIEKNKNCRRESCASALHALNDLHYKKNDQTLDVESLIVENVPRSKRQILESAANKNGAQVIS